MKSHPLACSLRGLAVAPVLNALPALATVVTVIADRETAIFAESPDNNLGAGNLIAGTNAFGGDNARSLLEFNIAAVIPTGSVINSVTFQIGTIRQSNRANPSAYELHRMLKDWNEGNGGVNVNTGSPALAGETTWNSQFHGSALWSVPGGQAGTDYVTLASGVGPVINSGDILYSITSSASLVADVQDWLDHATFNDGWIFIGTAEGTSGTARRFSSTEVPGSGIASALTPRIIVDYSAVPEPGTALWGAALGLVAGVRRIRNRRG
jgi:hypothetical protein